MKKQFGMFFVGIILLCASPLSAAAKPTVTKRAPAATETINDDMKHRIGNGVSLSPILGYDPTYGLLFGGAFFRGETEPPVNDLSLFLYGTLKNVYGLETKFTRWNREQSFFRIELEASNFFDAYFGEGNATTPGTSNKIDIFKAVVNPSYWYRFDRKLSFGVLAENRFRNETAVDGNTGTRIFGKDYTPTVGIAVNYDGRDHQNLTTQGQYYQAKLDYGPSLLSTRTAAEDFARLELESRHFMKASESIVLAAQLMAGAATGDPGYQYRFNLGGSRKLRGYQTNRLRGRFYYMAQGETRFSLTQWLGLVGFVGVGDVADTRLAEFSKPKLTGGIGVRLGLPPDFIARARLDFAFSPDESAFYLNFNEAF